MPELSRGENRCLRLLRELDAGSMRFAAPSRKWMAAQLECGLSTLDRWTAGLRAKGCITVKKRQHSSARYTIQTSHFEKSSEKSSEKSGRRFLSELKLSEGERLTPKGMGTATWAQSRGTPLLEWAYIHNYPVRTEVELREAEAAMERWVKEDVA